MPGVGRMGQVEALARAEYDPDNEDARISDRSSHFTELICCGRSVLDVLASDQT